MSNSCHNFFLFFEVKSLWISLIKRRYCVTRVVSVTLWILSVVIYRYGIKTLVSPFLGGASVELSYSSSGVPVFGYDLFEPLINFWSCALEDPKLVSYKACRIYPMTKKKFYSLRSIYHRVPDKWDRASIYYAGNRSSFSGVVFGGMSKAKGFTISAIQNLHDFNGGNLHVNTSDFSDVLRQHKDDFLYLDPPYVKKDGFYRSWAKGHSTQSGSEFNHFKPG